MRRSGGTRVALALFYAAAAGCGARVPPLPAAEALPPGFPTDFAATDDAANRDADVACPVQMRSPSSGTWAMLRVERVAPGPVPSGGRAVGEYEAWREAEADPPGQDGLVRFDCGSLRPLGVVPRGGAQR